MENGLAEGHVFEVCDEGKGYLSEEFKVAVVKLFGYKPSSVMPELLSWLKDFQWNLHNPPQPTTVLSKDKWKCVSQLAARKACFLNLMSAKKAVQLYSNETRQIFTAFDVQDRGFLTFEDFKKAFNSVSPKLSERIIVEAFREVDQDSDGCMSFKEFESAMKYGQDEVSPVYFA
ncbi:LOW QUALITY PROTEIN: EF-hand calcium-binding domain-containing protein 11 [Ciconia maguari]